MLWVLRHVSAIFVCIATSTVPIGRARRINVARSNAAAVARPFLHQANSSFHVDASHKDVGKASETQAKLGPHAVATTTGSDTQAKDGAQMNVVGKGREMQAIVAARADAVHDRRAGFRAVLKERRGREPAIVQREKLIENHVRLHNVVHGLGSASLFIEPSALAMEATDHATGIVTPMETLSLEKNPLEILGLTFFACAALLFMKTCFCDFMPRDKWNQVVEQYDDLTNTYDQEVDKLVDQIDAFANDATVLAEKQFQEKQRDYSYVLARAANVEDTGGDQTALLAQMRAFVLVWLKINEQCCLDPVNAPRHICSEGTLRMARTVPELMQAVAERIKSHPISLIGEDVNNSHRLRAFLMNQDDKMKAMSSRKLGTQRCCWCCCTWLRWTCGVGSEVTPGEDGPFPIYVGCVVLRITFYHWTHVWSFLCFFLGIGMTAMLAVLQKPLLFAGMTCVGTFLLFISLFFMDVQDMRQALAREMRHLQKKTTALARRRENVLVCYQKMQDLTSLWRYQTLPRLENYSALLEWMRDLAPDVQEAMLGAVVERLERMGEAMGDLSLWIGERALDEGSLRAVSEQIDECTATIGKASKKKKHVPYVLHCLGHAVGFVVVRIRACYNLPERRSGGVYVLIVVGTGSEDDSKQFRTQTIQDTTKPRWRQHGGPDYEEFFTEVTPDTRSITLQVLGEKVDSKLPRFGFVVSSFRKEPGVWFRQREALLDAKTQGQQSQGEIEYETFFANSAEHLDRLRQDRAVATLEDFLVAV